MEKDVAQIQIDAMNTLVTLSKKRTEMSAHRSYMNAERTLSVWVRTSLAAMIFGLALDRLDIFLKQISVKSSHFPHNPDMLTHILGIALIIYSMVMALFSSIQFLLFSRKYKKEFPTPPAHQAWLPFSYAFLIFFFGFGLLYLVVWIG